MSNKGKPKSPEFSAGLFHEWGEEAKDFVEYYEHSRLDFLSMLRGSDMLIEVGPRYQTFTRSGKVVDSYAIFLKNKPNDLTTQFLFIFSFDPKGIFLGYRDMEIKNNQTAVGFISTRFRGKGIAAAIDLVTQDLLQSIANRKGPGQSMQWKIENQNQVDLDDLRNKVGVEKSQVLEKEAEQARWQSLYGNDGKFGDSSVPDKKGKVITLAYKQDIDMTVNVNTIRLVRDASLKSAQVESREVSTFKDSNSEYAMKHKRLEMLKRFAKDSANGGNMVIDLSSEYE